MFKPSQKPKKITVIVTDDSALVRAILREILDSDPEIEVIAEAENGQQAVELACRLKPDLVTMDLEMPVMNGHDAIAQIMAQHAVPILVISSLDDAYNAYAAVSRGALEVMAKPQLDTLSTTEITRKVKLLANIKVIKHLSPTHSKLNNPLRPNYSDTRHDKVFDTSDYKEIFAIASSTGGPKALESMFKLLPADFPTPIVVAQHISQGFASGLVEWLDNNVPMRVNLAREAQILEAGHIYIAPSESHMQVTAGARIDLGDLLHDSIYHPNCDLLLNSIAQNYAQKGVGIICTGMGSDGAAGMLNIHQKGGTTLAQDEQSSVIFGMNQVAIKQQCIDQVLSLDAIPGKMLMLSGYGKR